MKYYQPHMTSLITDNTDPSHHYSITVKLVCNHLSGLKLLCVLCVCSALVLFNFSAEVGQLLLDHPTTVLAGTVIQTLSRH